MHAMLLLPLGRRKMQAAVMVYVVQLVFICAAAEVSEEFLRLTKVLKFLHWCLMSILFFLDTWKKQIKHWKQC